MISYIDSIYKNHIKASNSGLIDFNATVKRSSNLRGFIKPQVRFYSDCHQPFKPLPLSQAHAMLEWGMNWCVASSEANWLVLHAAILAKDNKAIIFPAPPGSGKSTLTAYLALKGWRLLSDEMTLIDPATLEAIPFVRPICLKNNSIDLIKSWFPDAVFSNTAIDTQKGDVAHVMPPANSVAAATERAEIIGVVFPRYEQNTTLDIYQLKQTDTFKQLIDNAFNYHLLGETAFRTIASIVSNAKNFEIHYNDLNEVESFLTECILDS